MLYIAGTLTRKWDSTCLCGHLRGHDGKALWTIYAAPSVFRHDFTIHHCFLIVRLHIPLTG